MVQLYTHQTVPIVTRPVKELKGFQRVTLEPRQTQTVSFRVAVNQLGFYDLDNRFVVEPGTVDVMVGSSSQDIHCTGSFDDHGREDGNRRGQGVFQPVGMMNLTPT